MTSRSSISVYILSLVISFSMLLAPLNAQAQKKGTEEADSIAFFRGFAVSVDLVGLIQMAASSYGQYEAALRINLKDRYFPIVEVGLGRTNNTSDVTQNTYKTSAPYFKVGIDFNLLKNKHDFYRVFAGLRYAFTSFKYDLNNPEVVDPVWGEDVNYDFTGVKCSYHWAEIVVGVDAKIWGPLHLGWSLRYKNRLFHNDGDLDKAWYVPGYGTSGNSKIGGTFTFTVDI
ncbi:MAG: DUF6048 family protein [Prevotella sp.]|nr:DUF6048 family protein [Prevotella sp.]